jgi:vacuolar-type H+-ATPase subunit E/Vma4
VNTERLRTSFLATVSAEVAASARTLEPERLGRIAAANADAERLIASARAAGEAEAANDALQLVAKARREARGEMLAARRETYERLRTVAQAEVLALRGSPQYRRLLDRLATDVRSQLGAGAVTEVDPDPVGGVISRDGHRSVDCSLPALANRCLDALGPRVEVLWK